MDDILAAVTATKLAISSSPANRDYKLPPLHNNSTAILDPLTIISGVELPSGMIVPKVTPLPVGRRKDEIAVPARQHTVVEKQAKSDLKQRRRHMNRHKLKKLRKRMKFVYMRLEQRKLKRKQLALKKECDNIVASAHKWSAEEEVMKDLELARKGGFSIDVFERKSL